MDNKDGPARKAGMKGDKGRTERLAAELRANLHRRKARARKLADAADGGGESGAGTGGTSGGPEGHD